MGLIDIHCHILPGLDDGPEKTAEALEMLRIASDDGISHIFATPHIIDGEYENRPEGINRALSELKEQSSFPVELLAGADIRITPGIVKALTEGEVLPLGSTSYILLELPTYSLPPNLENIFFSLRLKGFWPVITHPERHLILMQDMKKLRALKDSGGLVQVTAMSITGEFGRGVQKASLVMLEQGLVDFVATDAHNTKRRPPILSKAYAHVRKKFGEKVAERIFRENPSKVLNNQFFED
ncbi:MAG: hypothetical protein HGA78_12280 [Nitrospirales bacterium]|nr:hypothetical protein [Nitrospirales bacterium]